MSFFNATNIDLYIIILLSIINGVVLSFFACKQLQILQLSNYRNKEYLTNLKSNCKDLLMITGIFFANFILMLLFNIILEKVGVSEYYTYLGLIIYFALQMLFIFSYKNTKKKTPLKFTNRLKRLLFVFIVNCVILSFLLLSGFYSFSNSIKYAIIAILPIFLPPILMLSNLVIMPFEKMNYKRYIKLAKKKLHAMPNLIKIGVTGSFGKTSTKYFLNTILSEKYFVCMSPHNYNTPMGITKVVLSDLLLSHQVLIAEMGARYEGDIAELCDLVEPQYGIITSVGEQHLQTFKDFDTIKRTKYELVKKLPQNGLIVFNGNNKVCREYYSHTKIKKVMTGFNEKYDIFADEIETTRNGTEFILHIKDECIDCKTQLLGLHNIEDILLAVAMANELGLTIYEIASGINKLQPVEHRLELIKSTNGNVIIDDTYNGSIEGSKSALNILNLFEGQKIVITPGLVELGEKEKIANIEFGERIAEVADIVILVNLVNANEIKTGLRNKGFEEELIFEVPKLSEVQEIISQLKLENSTILFYNDLPDNYL